jgi:hypothetical protein
MPLNVRSISVSLSVVCFFCLSLIGWVSGLSPFICCKRALVGAVLAYIGGNWAVRMINRILINAIINRQIERHESFTANSMIKAGEIGSGGNDRRHR